MFPSKSITNVVLLGLLVLALLLTSQLSPVIGASSSTLLISEVLYDVVGTEPDGEWIEIYNAGDSAIDLSNYKVGDEEEQGGGEGMLQFPPGTSINAGQVIVIANNATAFLGVWGTTPDYEMGDSDEGVPDMIPYTAWAGGAVQLANSGDEVLILDGGDAIVDAMSYGSKTTFLDPPCPDVSASHSLERSPANVDTDTAEDWIDQESPDPGAVTVPTPTPTSTPTFTATTTSMPTHTPTSTPTATPTHMPTLSRIYLPTIMKLWPPIPEIPVLHGISDPDGDGNYTVSWSPAARAVSYTLQEDRDSSFPNPIVVYSGAETLATVTGRAPGPYYYRVKATNSWGGSAWSQVKSVTVMLPTPTPTPRPGVPVDGHWIGSSPNERVSFDVSGGGAVVIDFTMEFDNPCPGCFLVIRYVPYAGGQIPITNKRFSYGESGLSISGRFTSSTTATIEYSYSSCCGGVCCFNRSGTWTATAQ